MFDPDSGGSMEVPVYWRPDLSPGASIKGPALIAEDETTTFVTAAFDAVDQCARLHRPGSPRGLGG